MPFMKAGTGKRARGRLTSTEGGKGKIKKREKNVFARDRTGDLVRVRHT